MDKLTPTHPLRYSEDIPSNKAMLMPIKIGQKPESSFSDPVGLLGDCHRRIESFLSLLIKIAQTGGCELNAERREALEKALRYFREAAPNHTRDEEESLFPRMRKSKNKQVQTALAALDTLEADHDKAEKVHAEVETLGQRWLAEGRLSTREAKRLSQVLDDLKKTYERHIAVEDSDIFPLAGNVLEKSDLAEVGREMAVRRGIRPGGKIY
jgi:hemerythrin-like domain-containing protein